MLLSRVILAFLIFLAVPFSAKSQFVGFRLGLNSGVFIDELGNSDVLHPYALVATSPLSSNKYSFQPTLGVEGEILFQVSPMSHFGIELEYSKLKGYNNNPPVYNYYLTPYYLDFQSGGEYVTDPVAFNTSLFNVAVNWKYFFFQKSPLKPFLKLTGVVAFVGSDFKVKNMEDVIGLGSDVLYARGTSNSDQKKLPAFHLGGGIGFDYKIGDYWSVQLDAIATVVNSDIINGVPNFSYEPKDGKDMLVYHKRAGLTMQISAGVVYYIEIGASGKSGRGRTDPSLPFYRRK